MRVGNISFWERESLLSGFDFLILGAGLTGMQVGLQLHKKFPGARIGLIDRSPFSAGASTRNAGFACFGSPSEILDDLSRSSEQEVFSLAAKRFHGIRLLKEDFGEQEIDFEPVGGYEIFTESESGLQTKVSDNLDYLNSEMRSYLGVTNIFQQCQIRDFGFNASSDSVFNSYEGQLNTGKLFHRIRSAILSAGIEPLFGLEITGIETNGEIELQCKEGYVLKCSKLVICTNGFSDLLPFPLPETVEPARGQIILTEPLEHIPFEGLIHGDRGFMYSRCLGKRILLGGGRNLFHEQEKSHLIESDQRVREYLEDYLSRVILPGRRVNIEMHWSGIMGMGDEKIPIVHKAGPNVVLCIRLSGMGVALGPVLARETAALF